MIVGTERIPKAWADRYRDATGQPWNIKNQSCDWDIGKLPPVV